MHNNFSEFFFSVLIQNNCRESLIFSFDSQHLHRMFKIGSQLFLALKATKNYITENSYRAWIFLIGRGFFNSIMINGFIIVSFTN